VALILRLSSTAGLAATGLLHLKDDGFAQPEMGTSPSSLGKDVGDQGA